MTIENELEEGCFNPAADKVPRKDECWSDGKFNWQDFAGRTFDRLKCENCEGVYFEVLTTDKFETTAQCVNCGKYFIVHSG